ncbi:MAG: helix-turn-helix domain-containing protein [Saprospiraceae bacterium]
MLILMKQNSDSGISKRALMDEVGACSQSIQNWRTLYKEGGLEKLLMNGRKGNSGKPSVISAEEEEDN